MTVYDKKLKELSIILQQGNNFKVTEAIRSLRKGPPLEGAIGLLVSFYDRSSNSLLKKIVGEFMNDLKGQSLCGEIVAELKKKRRPDTINMLVSSCWQSRLDYSGYCTDFAKIFLMSNYMTAIECFTVIEGSSENLDRGQKDEIIRIMERSSLPPDDEKTPLLNELMTLLD